MENMTLSTLTAQFKSLEKFCDGTLGVSAYHFPSNRQINFNEKQFYLMCSTFKVPIAIYLLAKVQRGELQLTDMCAISEYDLRPGVDSTLNRMNFDVSQNISVRNLLQWMMQESCNSATDLMVRYVGGVEVVKNYLIDLGLQDILFSHWEFSDFAAWEGIQNLPPLITLQQYAKLEASVPPAEVQLARENIMAEIKRTNDGCTTPLAMNKLLVKLFQHELINPELTDLLLKIMRRCFRGENRLIGMLPPTTPLAHKTGTLTGFTSDVGIMTLPEGAGHVAVSAYIKDSSKGLAPNERVLADVGRAVYDYFLYAKD